MSKNYTHTLIISPQSGEFLINADLIGDMDPFVRVKIGDVVQQTETAYNQGKKPTWKNSLTFRLTAEQVAKPESVVMLIEAFDEDPGSEDFLGRTNFTLAQMQQKIGGFAILEMLTGGNKPVGTVSIQFELKKDGATTEKGKEKEKTSAKKTVNKTTTQKTPELVTAEKLKPRFTKVIGTVVVKPLNAKFEMGVSDLLKLYLVLLHGDSAFKTKPSEGSGRKPVFSGAISMPLYDEEELIVRVYDFNVENSGVICEAKINLPELATRNKFASITTPFCSGTKKIGDLNVEIEFFAETFENPVRVFPVVGVKKGAFVNKKVKYNNFENTKKTLIIRTENKDIVFVKTPSLTLLPNESVEIRFRLLSPPESEVNCKVDIIVEEMREIEESLLFRVKST